MMAMCNLHGIYTSPPLFVTNMALKILILVKIMDDGHERGLPGHLFGCTPKYYSAPEPGQDHL
jgi:hypothetical protein